MAQVDTCDAAGGAQHLQRLSCAPPADTPQGYLGRIASAVVNGTMTVAEARRRFAAFVSGRDAKAACWARHYLSNAIATCAPRGLLESAARCVRAVERERGTLLGGAPAWIIATRNRNTRELYARLRLFALALGFGGRDFVMAQCVTARLFSCDGGQVREFMRKAVRHGFVALKSRGRRTAAYSVAVGGATVTRWRRAANVYTLARAELEADATTMHLYGLLYAFVPALDFDDGERRRLAAQIVEA